MNYDIQLEDDTTIEGWLLDFLKPENQDRYLLPGCPYSYGALVRESIRREYIRTAKKENDNEV